MSGGFRRNDGSPCMLKIFCEEGKLEKAIELLDSIAQRRHSISVHHVFFILQHCISRKDLLKGRLIHSFVKSLGFESNAFLGTHLIRLFHVCKSLPEANDVFEKICEKNVYVWSAIISAHACLGKEEMAMDLFCKMEEEESHLKPDKHVYIATLKACSNMLCLRQGKIIHSCIIKNGFECDVFVRSILIDMYSKSNHINDAQVVFDSSEIKDIVLWNAMIGGCLQDQRVFELFEQMQIEGVKPNTVFYINILKSCSLHKSLTKGRLVHSCIIYTLFELDVALTNTLIDMYAKCGNMAYACHVFEDLPNRDIVTWNVMISGYAQNGYSEDVILLFDRMQHEGIEPNNVTFNTMIAAHSQHGYCDEAIHLFNRMQKEGFLPDLITWNTFLSGQAQHGEDRAVLQLFGEMMETGISPNKVTFLSVIKASSNLASIHDGEICNHVIIESSLESDMMVVSTLIDMYARCGNLKHAKLVFEKMRTCNVMIWTAMIGGFVHCGQYRNALKLFGDMQREGWKPNDVTFVSILSACSHAGLIDEGYAYFQLMRNGYKISPTIPHYNCFIDLFGAIGYLLEAQYLLLSIPLEHNIIGWTSLLSHCRKYTEAGIARKCFERSVSMDCRHASFYAMMSSMYSEFGMWEDAEQTQAMKVV